MTQPLQHINADQTNYYHWINDTTTPTYECGRDQLLSLNKWHNHSNISMQTRPTTTTNYATTSPQSVSADYSNLCHQLRDTTTPKYQCRPDQLLPPTMYHLHQSKVSTKTRSATSTNNVTTPYKVSMKTRQTTWHQVVTSIARHCHANIIPSTGQDSNNSTPPPPPVLPEEEEEEEEEDIPFLVTFFIVFNHLTVV